jgi:tetratricopeptide (TPR) repeat protein
VIAIDNLQWIDKTSEDCFRSLAESIARPPIVLLSTYRPGYHPPWIEKSYATQMVLLPLEPDESLRVVHSTLHQERLSDALIQLILDKAEGNPFFLEELTRAVVELRDRGSNLVIPDTIQGVLMARIDALPPAAKHLLQSAAVFGREIPLALLLAIAELPEEVVSQALMHLQASELLSEKRAVPVREYTFKHVLTQEVAYANLPREQQRALHANIVGALERLSPDRLDEQTEQLADHALRGEVWDKAVVYFGQAGTKAVERSANHEAVACFEQALVALKHLPEDREWLEQAIDLRLDLRRALYPLGEYERILEYLREADILAKALGDPNRIGRVYSNMSIYHFWMGNQADALNFGECSLSVATELSDFALQIEAHERLGMAYYGHGNYGRALEFLKRNVAALEGDLLCERFGQTSLPSVSSRSCLVWCLAELGKFPEGVLHGEEGIRIAEAADQPFSLIVAYLGIGFLYLRKGDLSKAIFMLEHGLEFCRIWNIPAWFPAVSSALGYAYTLSGHLAKALPLLNEAVEQARRLKTIYRYALMLSWLSETHLLAGQLHEAISSAQHALKVSREHNYRGQHAWTLRLLGEIASQQYPADVKEAEASFRQALALADDLKMRPLVSHCRLGLGTLYAKMGRVKYARIELAAAIELYRAMEMTLWLAQAEVRLAQTMGSGASHSIKTMIF